MRGVCQGLLIQFGACTSSSFVHMVNGVSIFRPMARYPQCLLGLSIASIMLVCSWLVTHGAICIYFARSAFVL
jgi:hypothetical protein